MGKGEFERIKQYFAPLSAGFPGAFGLTDDGAVVSPPSGHSMVITTDTIVEGIHFIGNEAADLVARKLLRVSLSDLASMGASPWAYTINVSLPNSVDDKWLELFVLGLKVDQIEFDMHLIGGDTVTTTGPVVISATLFGLVSIDGLITRSGAQS